MDKPAQYLLDLARRTLTDPQDAARAVLAMRLGMKTRWMALALTSILSSVLLHASLKLLPRDDRDMMPGLPGPFESALAQAGVMILTSVLIHRIGRWRGGTGSFADALILMVWLQTILLGFQLVQIAALLIVPAVTNILGMLGIALFFWLLTSFIVALHGFASAGRVLVGIVVTVLVASVLLSMLMLPFLPAGG